MPQQRPRAGFTLVELVIVVSIIGMLASIAIPNYLRYQLRTRATASMTHLSAIATVESAYYTEFGTYLSVSAPVPGTLPGTVRVAWPSGSAFDLLGFAPEGSVRFQYAVGADDAGTGNGTLQRYTAEATADLDGDGQQSFFAYVRPAPGVGGLDGFLPGSTCLGSGVVGVGGAATLLRSPGPCDTVSGRSRF